MEFRHNPRAHLALQKPKVANLPGATSYVYNAFSVDEHLALRKPRVAKLPGAMSYVCNALGVDEQKTSICVVVSGAARNAARPSARTASLAF